jgi:glycerol dehydrogenase-like iron-containing ADH family enzyme
MMKNLLTWLALIIVALWLINDPTGAAAAAHHVAHALSTLASSL